MPQVSKAGRDVDDRGAKSHKNQVDQNKNIPSPGPAKNKDIACQRCGACCHVDMIAYATPEDFARWEKEERHDIIGRIKNNEVMWAGDRIISKSGRKLTTCFYLDWDGSSFFCKIYETRPLVCRNFIPGSSELCPQFYREKNRTSIKS